MVATFTPFYPAVNKVGTALRNNMEATMVTKGLEMCQGELLWIAADVEQESLSMQTAR